MEEQEPVTAKGFAEPVRSYKVLGIYDDLAREGTVIREEADGFKLCSTCRSTTRPAPEAILARLKG